MTAHEGHVGLCSGETEGWRGDRADQVKQGGLPGRAPNLDVRNCADGGKMAASPFDGAHWGINLWWLRRPGEGFGRNGDWRCGGAGC